jgi:hypothetical protein
MNKDTMKILLAIEQRSKAIPYETEDRKDGTKNSGFRALKGATKEAILDIPEAQDCPVFAEALIALNAAETPLFTVGCEKSLNRRQHQFWKRGYLEFSYNYAELVKDAVPYFTLFFHFDRATREFVSSRSVQFLWELQQARFEDANVDGFTCCVWITAGDFPTATKCEEAWDEAVRELTQGLLTTRLGPKASELPPIYKPLKQ